MYQNQGPPSKSIPKIVNDPDFQNELKTKLEKGTGNIIKFNFDTIN